VTTAAGVRPYGFAERLGLERRLDIERGPQSLAASCEFPQRLRPFANCGEGAHQCSRGSFVRRLERNEATGQRDPFPQIDFGSREPLKLGLE
jgi:hypothetical protein